MPYQEPSVRRYKSAPFRVEDVVVEDLRFVADLTKAVARPPQRDRPLPERLEVRVLAR